MTTETATPAAQPEKTSIQSALQANLRDYGLLLALILIMVFFQITTNGTLFKPVNLTNLVLQNSYIIIMALGMLLVIVAGHIDLSVGSVSGFIGALAAVLMVQYKVPPIPAGLLCLVAGGIIGAAQGYWIAYHKIPSFIVTLAGMLVFKGLSLALLGGASVGPFPTEFQLLSAGFIPDVIGPTTLFGVTLHTTTMVIGIAGVVAMLYFGIRSRANRERHGYEAEPFPLFVTKNLIIGALVLVLTWLLASYKGLPNVLVVMSILIALFVFVTRRTTIGRRIYAMGGNEKAAKLSGIKTERLTFLTFVNMGVLAALAGLIFAARLNTATPKAGQGFELDVIAAVFIGGASAMGGVGQVAGAVIGAFIMGVMNNGMSIMGVNIDWQQVIKGLVLLAAVVFDVYNKNKG
ncbi:ABC transporter permease [Youhaiella tibetensis]|uniref:Xylose transport system permease protein XylH n=1 Tax=Paradevosia tibetensis TaxID=1447062 RepID=A0A5B9DRJ5_9HYPH|nr:multiple monosaccharide ABC transporter permease [Youhaiella tibetensis]AKR56659.1 ABC transporter permease [Devosia sp. H5989]QEE21692.1 sugar ABC transporter permease [Youhaiella tibetensis]GGF12554.1 ABC transporter permease [Youhaiella tibetensis]